MANAKPIAIQVEETGAPQRDDQAAPTAGAPVSIAGVIGRDCPAGAVVRPSPGDGFADYVPQGEPPGYEHLPDCTNGKVFATVKGVDGVCSGTAVNSQNKSVVWTAGHCVHSGGAIVPERVFYENWIFVPAYNSLDEVPCSADPDGARVGHHCPYGIWTARELWTRREWAASANVRQDLGAAVVRPIRRVRLVARVGGQGIEFNSPYGQVIDAFGYPAAPNPNRPPAGRPQFDGTLQYVCDSEPSVRLGPPAPPPPPPPGPDRMQITCDFTQGSSGGAWLTDVNGNGLGFVTSVVSTGTPPSAPTHVQAPYQGAEALSLYRAVEREKRD